MGIQLGRGRVALGICAAAFAVHTGVAGAAIGGGTPTVIDAFDTNQSALTLTYPPTGTTDSSSVSGAGILGDERDMAVSLTGGIIAGNTLSAVVSSGMLS